MSVWLDHTCRTESENLKRNKKVITYAYSFNTVQVVSDNRVVNIFLLVQILTYAARFSFYKKIKKSLPIFLYPFFIWSDEIGVKSKHCFSFLFSFLCLCKQFCFLHIVCRSIFFRSRISFNAYSTVLTKSQIWKFCWRKKFKLWKCCCTF